jgi:hypothetical protein
MVPLIFALVFGFFGGAFYLVYRYNQQRIADIKALGLRLKLQYFQQGDSSLAPMLANLDFFSRGDRIKVSNLLKGQIRHDRQQVSVAIFDYEYTLSRTHQGLSIGQGLSVASSTDSDSFIHTMLVFYDDRLDLPHFIMRPEHIFDKVGNLIGWADINFPDFPQFSKRYSLKGEEVDRIRSLFQPDVIKFCEQAGLSLEARGSYLVAFPIYRGNHHEVKIHDGVTASQSQILDAGEIQPHLARCFRLLTLLAGDRVAV